MIDLPKATLSIIPAEQLSGVAEQRVLLVGQTRNPDSADKLYRDFPNDGSEDDLFIATSHIAGMVRAFKAENKVTSLDVLSLADAVGATKGTGVITFGVGPAGADTTIYVTVGSGEDYRKEITITSGSTTTTIGEAVANAYATDLKKPFTIVNSGGVVTATAINGGALCNEWGLQVEGVIDGVTVAITAWTGGATDPTLTSVLDAIGDTRYQTILWPEAYDLSVVQTMLDARFNTSNAVNDGVVVQVKSDTLANLKTYADQNSQSVVIVGMKKINDTLFKGPNTLEFPDVAAAQICAIRALRKTDSAPLTQYLTTTAPNDQFGGMGSASLPYFNTALPNLPVASPANQFSETDLAELSSNGVSVVGPNKAFNGTIFGEFVTTYLTDTAGNADTSYKFLNTVDTASVVREYFFTNFKSRYAQTRLTEGGLLPGRDMANASSIRAFCFGLYDALANLALLQKGTAAKKDYDTNLAITLDISAGSVTINQAPLLVSQLRVILGTIQVNFGG